MPELYRHFIDYKPEIRKAADGRPTIAGYAAVFNSLSNDFGGWREIIKPGAFDETLANNPDVSARIQHEGGLTTVGRTRNGTLTLRADDTGLWYEAKVPDTTAGRDIVELISQGYITKSSFAFTPRGDKPFNWLFSDDGDIREVLNVDLWDVAPVDGPAYEATTVKVRGLILEEIAEAKRQLKPRGASIAALRAEIQQQRLLARQR
jgi:uncharacterized protein